MLVGNIVVENMSHLTSSFAMRGEESGNYTDRDHEGIHPTQQNKKRIKVQLLFVIPGEVPEERSFDDQKPEGIPRIVGVRVPKGVPVAKIRPLIRHIESSLHDIYGRSKRLNFVMICDEDSNNWSFDFELPTFGVVYV